MQALAAQRGWDSKALCCRLGELAIQVEKLEGGGGEMGSFLFCFSHLYF
jgi:hypothetical protein